MNKIKLFCTCGHPLYIHRQEFYHDTALDLNDCLANDDNGNYCECKLYQQDNLKYLKDKYAEWAKSQNEKE